MEIWNFFLVSLLVWRVSSLLAREEGPFDLLVRLRLLVGVEYNKQSEEVGTNWVSKGILCVWCNSIWVAALGALLVVQDFVQYFVHLFALSAMAIILDELINRLGR